MNEPVSSSNHDQGTWQVESSQSQVENLTASYLAGTTSAAELLQALVAAETGKNHEAFEMNARLIAEALLDLSKIADKLPKQHQKLKSPLGERMVGLTLSAVELSRKIRLKIQRVFVRQTVKKMSMELPTPQVSAEAMKLHLKNLTNRLTALSQNNTALSTRAESFWRKEVNRPFEDSEGELGQIILDEGLNSESSSFGFLFELPQKAYERLATVPTEIYACRLLHQQLRNLVLVRHQSEDHGKSHIALPESAQYAVVIWQGDRYCKCLVTHQSVAEESGAAFMAEVAQFLAAQENWQTAQSWQMVEAQKKAYSGKDTVDQRKKGRLDPQRFDVADVSLAIRSGQSAQSMMAEPRQFTFGVNIPIALGLGLDSNHNLENVSFKVSHPYTDGQPAKNEQQAILQQVEESLSELGEAPVSFGEFNAKADVKSNLNQISQEKEQTLRTFILEIDSQRIDALFQRYLPEKGQPKFVRLTALLHLALSVALGQPFSHYLEATKDKGLAPAISVVPQALFEWLQHGKSGSNKELLKAELVESLKMLARERQKVVEGRGTVPIMAVVAGNLRWVLQPASLLLDRVRSQLLSGVAYMNSFLISEKRSTVKPDNGYSPEVFVSALSKNYTDFVCGATDLSPSQILISLRAYQKAKVPEDISQRCHQILERLLKLLEQPD